MLKVVSAIKLRKLVKQFGSDSFSTVRKVQLCKLCSVSVNHVKKYYVEQHIPSNKHRIAKYYKFLRIWIKINRQEFKTYFQKQTEKKLPDESTLRKYYVDRCYIEVLVLELYKWSPLVSADVERTFSTFKSLLPENRMRLLPENIKIYMIVQCFYN